jgi:hypothetical protein
MESASFIGAGSCGRGVRVRHVTRKELGWLQVNEVLERMLRIVHVVEKDLRGLSRGPPPVRQQAGVETRRQAARLEVVAVHVQEAGRGAPLKVDLHVNAT